jgi:hypothetical protein
LDAAARQFSEAYDAGQHPMEIVNAMRKKGELIMGIGHRVKSINNPDMRVSIIKVKRVLPFLLLFLSFGNSKGWSGFFEILCFLLLLFYFAFLFFLISA